MRGGACRRRAARARELRLERWRTQEERRSAQRLARLAQRMPQLRMAVATATERVRLQRSTQRLLLLPGGGAIMGSLEDQATRNEDTVAFEGLSALRDLWEGMVRLEAEACTEEDVEWSADQRRWDFSEWEWLMRHLSWHTEVAGDAPPPATTELLAKRTQLEEIRSRLEPLLETDRSRREAERSAAPLQALLMEEVKSRLAAEKRVREAGSALVHAACEKDAAEAALRKEKEEAAERLLAAHEGLSVARRGEAETRRMRGGLRGARLCVRAEHAETRKRALSRYGGALAKATADQQRRLEMEALRVERQRPVWSKVRVRLSTLVNVGVTARVPCRGERARRARARVGAAAASAVSASRC